MTKKIISILLTLVLTFPLLTTKQKAYAQQFNDLQTHWAKKDIELLKEKKLINGYEDGAFRPESPISRAESVSIIMRLLNFKVEKNGSSPFRDVAQSYWANDEILSAYQNQLLSGYEDGQFHPESPITRAEITVLLARAFQLKEDISKKEFEDVNQNHWAFLYIKKLAVNGLIEGTSNSLFQPDKAITRAEFATVLARAIEKKIPLVNEKPTTIYQLVPADWSIYNDGTHPAETTKGLNDALKWARENGKTVFKVPAGTYLIKKPADVNDRTAQIEMVSDMTFWMDDQAVLQKETNGFENYILMNVGQTVKNATLKGGTYRGDKDTHDYSKKDFSWSYGTHEGGMGIMLAGPENITVDGVKSTNFTGDALCVCGDGKQTSIAYQQDFESGSIDDNGVPVADSTKVRTKNNNVTSFADPVFQISKMFGPSLQVGRPQKMPMHIYFYKADGTFISSIKNQELMWSLITIPEGAGYYRAVLETTDTAGIEFMTWYRTVTRNSVIKNSEFSFSRRQGITVGGADHVLITNNKLHDIKGTAPESGIDLEGGTSEYGNRNTNIFINSNNFYNNEAYDVILYDGQDVTVEDNYLGTNSIKGTVGVAVSSPFRTGALIKNNTFDGSKIANGNKATYLGNRLIDTMASITGHGIIIDGMTLTNSTLWLQGDLPYGITPSNITINNTNGTGGRLVVDTQPVHATNVKITGKSNLGSLGGNAPDGSTFDNLQILAYGGGIGLPRGTYTNCVFEADSENDPPPSISGTGGTWVLDGCSIKTKKNLALSIDNPSANVTVKNSILDVAGELFGAQGVILAKKAARIDILNNTLSALGVTQNYITAVKINNYGAAGSPAGVLNATIRGNTITTNIKIPGISTTDTGSGASPYRIENNILNTAILQLRPEDISIGNVLH